MTVVSRWVSRLPWLLAGVLASAAAGMAVASGDRPPTVLLAGCPRPVLLGLLGAAFLLVELPGALLHTEFRRQAYSFSLAHLPLVVALLTCGVQTTVWLRCAAALMAFAAQRTSVVKMAYNTAAYSFEAAADGALLHRLLPATVHHQPLSWVQALVVYLAVAATDVVVNLLVLAVIASQTGSMDRRQAGAVLGPAAAFCLGSATVALTVALLLSFGALGVALLLLIGVAATAVFRSYRVVHRRHEALELVHTFVERSTNASTVEEVATTLLGQVRELMCAAEAELHLLDGDTPQRLVIDEDNRAVFTASDPQPQDWLLTRVLEQEEPVLVARGTRDAALRRWLTKHSYTDAMIVPLTTPLRGLLLVRDRLGDTAVFTREDLVLLQTLGGHLAIALHNTGLLERLRHDASHDVLTGLANRGLLVERITDALAASPGAFSVILLDLDRFKEVNDALGHGTGDQLLQVVGERLAREVPPGATVARLGGDEFALLLPPSSNPPRDAREVASRLAAALAEPVALGEALVATHASIGVATALPGQAPEELLRHADTAMYAAKTGEHHTVHYTPELDRGRAEKLALLADLQIALTRGELQLHYQPQMALDTGNIVALEALVRWQHPRLGLIYPDVFIPLAESSGLMDQLTPLVLDLAISQWTLWHSAGLEVNVAVNVSARNISNPQLPDLIEAMTRRHGMPPHRLTIEITESSIMGDAAETIPVLHRLATLGITLSLDDFGTGYSSLAYLQRLPVREVKIDRSFVTGLTHPDTAQASDVLIRSILNLAASFGLTVVAEGIEDAATLTQLTELGCQLAQGYHISRPLDAAATTTYLLQQNRRGRSTHLSAVSN